MSAPSSPTPNISAGTPSTTETRARSPPLSPTGSPPRSRARTGGTGDDWDRPDFLQEAMAVAGEAELRRAVSLGGQPGGVRDLLSQQVEQIMENFQAAREAQGNTGKWSG